MMWVGSSIVPRNPDIWIQYNKYYPYGSRINDVITGIKESNADLSLIYFEEPVKL